MDRDASGSALVRQAVDGFIEEQRARCLWFVDPSYRPSTDADRLRLLHAIKQHGDRAAWARAAELERCLSPTSSAASAAR